MAYDALGLVLVEEGLQGLALEDLLDVLFRDERDHGILGNVKVLFNESGLIEVVEVNISDN